MSVVTFTGHNADAYLNHIAIPTISSSGDVLISYNGVSGLDYILESTGNLIDPTWTPVWTNTADVNGLLSFTNTLTGPQEFYRTHSDSSAAHPVYP